MNYRHLHYFWVVAKEGGFARAADRLGVAIQTVSAQVKALEQELGHQLLKPAGRSVALTEAGTAVFAKAESIFQIGESIPDALTAVVSHTRQRLAVGMSDGLSKLATHSLLAPVLAVPGLRLVCHEGEVDELLADLALHRLDLVLACQPPVPNTNLRLTSDRLLSSPVDWYGPATLVKKAHVRAFPACLAELPLLLPTAHAALRGRIDRWLETQRVVPRVVGEFEDSALMSLFAAQGMGVFPVASMGAAALSASMGLRWLGRSEKLHEEIHAIRSQRGQQHPLVLQLLGAARRAAVS